LFSPRNAKEMICAECVRLINEWNELNQEFSHRTTALTAAAICGDMILFANQSALVEEARLRAENARAAAQIHCGTHSGLKGHIKATGDR
jgi:hypothetical protein